MYHPFLPKVDNEEDDDDDDETENDARAALRGDSSDSASSSSSSLLLLLSQVGGKGLSLIRAAEHNFPVPKRVCVVGAEWFEPWIENVLFECDKWTVFTTKVKAM